MIVVQYSLMNMNNYTTPPPQPNFLYKNKEEPNVGNTTYDDNREGTVSELDICFITIEALSICLNAVLFFKIISLRRQRRQKPNQFFINLLLLHILVSMAIIVAKFYLPEESVVVNNGFFLEMFLCLLMCSTDRYIYIKFPYMYANLTTSRIICMVASSWVITGSFVVLSMLFKITIVQSTALCTAIIIVASLVLVSSNINIYIIAKRHQKAILKFNTATVDREKESRSLKATYVCLTLVGSFVITWVPLLVHNVLVLAHAHEPTNGSLFTVLAQHIGFSNSIVDPLLYIYFRQDLRESLKRITRSLRIRKMGRYQENEC